MKALGVWEQAESFKDIVEMDMPVRPAGETEVVVEVHAEGLNPQDYRNLEPFPAGVDIPDALKPQYPAIAGFDFAGRVAEIGSGVTKFAVGDDVYGRFMPPISGAAAEYATIDQSLIAKMPSSISYAQAATIPTPFDTASWFMLHYGRVEPGQTALVLGGAGGVGSMAVMLAKHAGATVVASGLTKDMPALEASVADLAIDSQKGDWSKLEDKVDVVLNTVNERTLADAIPHVKDGGIVVAMTLAEGQIPEDVRQMNPTLSWVFFEVAPGSGEMLETANELVEEGTYVPAYEQEFEFSAQGYIEALAKLKDNKKTGRLVLKVRD